jgi:hypothetical protein
MRLSSIAISCSRDSACLGHSSMTVRLSSVSRRSLTRTGGRRRWPATGIGELLRLFIVGCPLLCLTGSEFLPSVEAASETITLPMAAWPPSFMCTCSTRTSCCPPVRRRRRTSNCIVYAFIKRAAVDPKAAIRRSVPKALSIFTSTDIAAAWVQAI